ncbi:ABC transporter B family member 15-like protein, partial [Tanacetum coccineum]
KEFLQTFMILVNTSRIIVEARTMTTDLSKGSQAVKSVFVELDRETLINPEHPNGNKPVIVTGHVEIHDVVTFPTQNTSRYNDAYGLIDNEAPRDSSFSTLYNMLVFFFVLIESMVGCY